MLSATSLLTSKLHTVSDLKESWSKCHKTFIYIRPWSVLRENCFCLKVRLKFPYFRSTKMPNFVVPTYWSRFYFPLTHFVPLVSFYTPWKRQKTRGFLFLAVVKVNSQRCDTRPNLSCGHLNEFVFKTFEVISTFRKSPRLLKLKKFSLITGLVATWRTKR